MPEENFCALFVKNGAGHLTLDISMGYDVLQLPCLDVTVDDDNSAVSLQPDGSKGAGLVEREVPGDHAARRERLDKIQGSSVVVDGESHDGVRWDLCAVVGVKVGNRQLPLSPGRHNQELVIGLDGRGNQWLASGDFLVPHHGVGEQQGLLTDSWISAAVAVAGALAPPWVVVLKTSWKLRLVFWL